MSRVWWTRQKKVSLVVRKLSRKELTYIKVLMEFKIYQQPITITTDKIYSKTLNSHYDESVIILDKMTVLSG